MSRCKCCQAILTSFDLTLTQDDGSYEDLCGLCRWYAYNDEYIEVKTYAFEDLTEHLVGSLDIIKEIENNY